jgi:phosphoesterase RecJ-like protein
VISDERVNRKFSFLSGFDQIESIGSLSDQTRFDRAIFVDTPSFHVRRVGDVVELLNEGARVLVVDHHSGHDDEGDVRLVDPLASAASELVFRLIQEAGIEVTAEVATQIYAGIAFDTKLFKFSHPDRALKVCAELADLGADPQEIADALFAHESFETIKTLGAALSSLELHMEGRVSTLVVDHAVYAMGGDLDYVVDYATAVEGVEIALFFKEEAPGRFRVSLRSRCEVDVNEIAQAFGGGGHPKASGCQIEGALDEAKQELLRAVEQKMTPTR